MSTAIKSKSVSLAAIFDPYVAGTTKARAAGIDDAGNDTSNLYANIIYGSAAAATGIQSQGADLNTLYAKIGTAAYPLGFASVYHDTHAGPSNVALTFDTTSTFAITGAPGSTLTGSPLSGSLFTYGTVTQVLLTNLGFDNTRASVSGIAVDTWVPITAGLLVLKYATTSLTGNNVVCTATVKLRNSAGTILSVTNTNFNIFNTNPS